MPRLDGFEHRSGHHCGSTSLRNLADFYDWGFDEPTCFGLASGLGFTYFDLPESPHRAFFGRPLFLERACLDHLGVAVDERADEPWDALRSRLCETVATDPVLLFTDIYYLDYYDTDTHFAPHSLLAVGVEDDAVLLADSEFEDLQRLPLPRLREALASGYVQPAPNRSLVVTDPDPTRSFPAAARRAIAETARYVRDPASVDRDLGPGDHGLAGIRALAADLPTWTDLPDPSWTVRFAYQNVERRGTGGGCFRRLYADFLTSAAEAVDAVPADASDRMRDIADDWTAVGETLKRASECDRPDEMEALLADASDSLRVIADREERLFTELGRAVGGTR